jgi:hypothetical protein
MSGCAIGVAASTLAQGPSGNGSSANIGPLQLRAITIVTGPSGSSVGTFLGTIVNSGATDDALVGVTITSPTGATVTLRGSALSGTELPLPAGQATRLGFTAEDHADVTGLSLVPSAYATVSFQFKVAGTLRTTATGAPFLVMAVPPQGIYDGLGPLTP